MTQRNDALAVPTGPDPRGGCTEAFSLLFLSFERATLRILNEDINDGGEIDSFST